MIRLASRMLRGTVGLGLVGLIAFDFGPVAWAQAPSASRTTPAAGDWTIAVVAPPADPAARALSQALRSNPWVVANSDRVKLAEMSTEPTGRPAVTGSLTVLVYQQGPRGPEMMGGRSGFTGGEDVIRWVRAVVSSVTDTSVRDPNLNQANHFFDKSLPSAQREYAPAPQASMPPSVQTQAPSYPQAMLPGPQTSTTYAMPMMAATANVVQAPTQHLIIQQQPTQVLFAPQGAPTVYVPQASAPAPAGNLFIASASPAPAPLAAMPAPAAAPSMPMTAMAMPAAPVAAAAMPMASVSAGPPMVAAGPMVAGAALTTSSVSVPASSTSSRVRVRGPGPLASVLSRLGERMTTLGRTRIESVQETRLETQTSQSPPGQYMTLSSTSASPMLTQPQSAGIPGQPQTCPPYLPAQNYPPQSPQASPQGGNGRWH